MQEIIKFIGSWPRFKTTGCFFTFVKQETFTTLLKAVAMAEELNKDYRGLQLVKPRVIVYRRV